MQALTKNSLLILFLLTILTSFTSIIAYNASPCGYYLPRGYYVEGTINFKDAPFWPGESEPSIIGLRTSSYDILIVGRASKDWSFQVWREILVIKKTNEREEVLAKQDAQAEVDHKVTIVYGNDGQVKISVNGELLYSFAGSADKYTILASNAKVNEPQVLQTSNQETGEGYLPEDNTIYLALGVGAVLVLIVVMLVVRR